MPHAAFAGISMPAAMIATMKHSVAFDAPDAGDVDLLLGLLWPSDVGGFLLTCRNPVPSSSAWLSGMPS